MWKKIICWLFVIIWLFVIFKFSSKSGENSANQSKGILIGVLAEGTLIAQKVGIIDSNLTQEQLSNIVRNLHGPIRKLAHLSVYLVLSIIVLLAFGTKNDSILRNSLIVVLICFIYSLTDEFHQVLIPGRSGEFTDCIIDTSGAIVGCLIYTAFLKLKDNS